MEAENNTGRKLILYASIFIAVFTILPILAPIFVRIGLEPAADLIYGIYQFFCHQRPWRSYHMFDYQYAMDARMMLMFASMAFSGFIIYFKRVMPLKLKTGLVYAFIMMMPLVLDGSIQLVAEATASGGELPFYESTNFTRSVTGLLFGTGFAFFLFPLVQGFDNKKSAIKDVARYSLITSVLSFILIPIFVLLWHFSSSEYKPSSPIIDFEQRYPGYNYEITTSAGHSTIERFVDVSDTDLYIERAKKYDRQDLIEDYTTK